MGKRFLKELYRGFLVEPSGLCLVAVDRKGMLWGLLQAPCSPRDSSAGYCGDVGQLFWATLKLRKRNMTQQEFLQKLSEMLEVDSALTGAEALSDLKIWDSVSVISFMAFADEECGILIAPKDIGKCSTVNDLFALVCEKSGA
jgi:acyl carrier protein